MGIFPSLRDATSRREEDDNPIENRAMGRMRYPGPAQFPTCDESTLPREVVA
ncbi:hypothetical protein KIN20_003882 [Parelaphostrongylus tenuis]|uniref:Uncharacterized protein n=1 Tax=Parelaphostrongylus tenuis TaxID=148309 RepID=A0AAD5QIW3_PARTN|nr:hypothetical protein KIN20_003882 [Parelaphostrongylus tenuis]